MIYYDSHKNNFIPLDIKDIDFNYTTTTTIGNECELVIRFDYSELEHFKEWINYLDQRIVRKVSEYKRDIFILSDKSENRKDMKFSNCYLVSINSYENYFEIKLYFDYYHLGGVYPELKAIYRDRKIDLILSK
jgi:hypothetical protein